MLGLIHLSVLVQMLLAAGPADDPSEFITIERLSPKVLLAYWVGTDRRCNLTAIQSQKGLVIIDTEMSPRIMAPIKKRIEQIFGRNDWAYVINTHAHDSHPGGNSLFNGAVIVGHENLWQDMQWIIRRQTEPNFKRRSLEHIAQLLVNLRNLLPQVAQDPFRSRLVRGEIKFQELHTQDLQEGYPVVRPSLTFADKHTLDLGDVTLELTFFGKGHSLSDILIYIPQEKVLVTGAAAYARGQLPEIGEDTHLEDIHRFIAVFNRFLADGVEIDRVVPSHSPTLMRSDLLPIRDYYQRMLDGVEAAKRQGLTFQQACARMDVRKNFPAFREPPLGYYGHGGQQRNMKNLWRILDEDPNEGSPPVTQGPEHPPVMTDHD